MRIQYTLPRMQAAGPNEEFVEANPASPGSFRSRLRRLAHMAPVSWKQILRLDQPSYTAATIGPPPRPDTLEVNDAASERLRWRNFLNRQPAVSSNQNDFQRMVGLLRAYQSMEDRVVSRYLADARG
jgi:hypothetical protein